MWGLCLENGWTAKYREGTDELEKSATLYFLPILKSIMMLLLWTLHGKLNLVQIYASTKRKGNWQFLFRHSKHLELYINASHVSNWIVVDFNTKIGQGKIETLVGGYVLRKRNKRGGSLVDFCQ